jgi:hypothetical protein
MDTPILPNQSEDVPPAPRAARTIWALRTSAAVIGLATSLLTLTHSWDFAVRTALGLKGPTAVWGTADGSRVCVDEIRAQAHGGAWRCISWQPVKSGEAARTADAGLDGGACSHRVADQSTGVWDCYTRGNMSPVALRYKGGVPQPVFGDRLGARLCIREYQVTPGQPWRCEEWGVRMPNVVFASAAPSGMGCFGARWADQDTGVWACGRRPW